MAKEGETDVLWVLLPLANTAERPAGRIEGWKEGEGDYTALFFQDF